MQLARFWPTFWVFSTGRFLKLLEGAGNQMGAARLLQKASMWQVVIGRLAQHATNFQPHVGPIHNYKYSLYIAILGHTKESSHFGEHKKVAILEHTKKSICESNCRESRDHPLYTYNIILLNFHFPSFQFPSLIPLGIVAYQSQVSTMHF